MVIKILQFNNYKQDSGINSFINSYDQKEEKLARKMIFYFCRHKMKTKAERQGQASSRNLLQTCTAPDQDLILVAGINILGCLGAQPRVAQRVNISKLFIK